MGWVDYVETAASSYPVFVWRDEGSKRLSVVFEWCSIREVAEWVVDVQKWFLEWRTTEEKNMTLLAWGEGFPGVARPASQCFNGQNSPAPGEPLEN